MSHIPKILQRSIPHNPTSITKTKRAAMQKHEATKWQRSKRQHSLLKATADTSSKAYQKLTKDLHRVHTSIIVQLHMGHTPLNHHLHRIKATDSPTCPTCHERDETVLHYLLHCHTYEQQRYNLQCKIGPDARNLQKLLSTRKHIPALINFVRDTRRFTHIFTRIPEVVLQDEKKHKE